MNANLCSDPDLWNGMASDYGTIFHTIEWCELMTDLPNVRFFPYIIEDPNINGPVLLPVFEQSGLWSWSMLGYGGPCLSQNQILDFRKLNAFMSEVQGRPTQRISLAPNFNIFTNREDPEWVLRPTLLLQLPTTYMELWNSCNGKARTSVRHAQRAGLVSRRMTLSELPTFFELYRDLMLAKGASVLPLSFFKRVWVTFPEEQFVPLGAFFEGELVAASFYLVDRTRLYYWLHASHSKGRQLQASYLLLQEAFKFAINKSLAVADLGYSHNNDIARPKKYWGGQEAECWIYRK